MYILPRALDLVLPLDRLRPLGAVVHYDKMFE